jgi:hypothetical protein
VFCDFDISISYLRCVSKPALVAHSVLDGFHEAFLAQVLQGPGNGGMRSAGELHQAAMREVGRRVRAQDLQHRFR